MKTIIFQEWIPILGDEIGSYGTQSNVVAGKGDEKLSPEKSETQDWGFFRWFFIKLRKWKKLIVIVPNGHAHVFIRPAYFCEQRNVWVISTARRKISDGPFAMRLGPKDCKFCVFSEESVKITLAGYFYRNVAVY